MSDKKIYMIDIDNTICQTLDSNYYQSMPYNDRIKKINKLYKDGHTVIYWTARGSKSGYDWQEFTKKQLDLWGCLRHNILFGKPNYDIYIDDKCIPSNIFFNQ